MFKKNLPLLLFIFSIFLSNCKSTNKHLVKELIIHSKEKGKDYPIWVQLPDEYYADSSTYNSIYLLDAHSDLETVAQKCKEISAKNAKKNVIIIGIGHGDKREIDYTPTVTKHIKGNNPVFMEFIKKEVIPKIEDRFRVNTSRKSRTIMGHSYGGLFGACSFVHQNDVFGNYILLSPSLFYDNKVFFDYEKNNRQKLKGIKQLVYIGIGGKEKGMIPESILFNKILKDYYKSTITSFQIIEGKGHNSSKEDNFQHGLDFYFKNN